MSVFDNVISAISPKAAYKREAWRQGLYELRNYDAGKNDRLNYGWRVANASGELTDGAYRDTIRARARDLERNSDIFNGVVLAMQRNIVGRGLTVQAKTGDEKINDRIEWLFKKWSTSTDCDAGGRDTLPEIIRTALTRKLIDGGILIIKVIDKSKKIPLQLQLIEVDALDVTRTDPKKKGNTVISGVEVDKSQRIAGYWISVNDGPYSTKSKFFSAKDVIFYCHRTRPSQIREMSQLASSLTRVRDINSYMEAVSVKERVAACLSVFIKKQQPSTGTGGIGRGSQIKDESSGYEGLKLTPGMVTELQPGDDISVVSPSNQGSGANDFMRLQQRLIGAGQGLSYEATARDMSQVNYSSARQGLIEDEKTYGIEQDKLISKVLSKIYREFVTAAVMAGEIEITGYWTEPEKYQEHIWIPPAKRWIDPQKEMNANKIALSTGQKTYQEICAEQGNDWKEQVDQIAAEQKYMEEKGVNIFEQA